MRLRRHAKCRYCQDLAKYWLGIHIDLLAKIPVYRDANACAIAFVPLGLPVSVLERPGLLDVWDGCAFWERR